MCNERFHKWVKVWSYNIIYHLVLLFPLFVTCQVGSCHQSPVIVILIPHYSARLHSAGCTSIFFLFNLVSCQVVFCLVSLLFLDSHNLIPRSNLTLLESTGYYSWHKRILFYIQYSNLDKMVSQPLFLSEITWQFYFTKDY